MKNVMFVLSFLSATAALAAPPTHIECTGINVKMTLDLSKPSAESMTVGDGGEKTATFTQLDIKSHALGTDYTTCEQSAPGAWIRCTTFRMPSVNIFYTQEKFAFKAELISHTRSPNYAKPQLVSGLLDHVENTTTLQCISADSPLSSFSDE